jgi:hypothetical protein
MRRAIREWRIEPAESENQGMYASSLHGNREIPGMADRIPRLARSGKARGRILTCTFLGSRTKA